MLAVINATLVLEDHYIPGAALLIDDGKIVDFGKNIKIPAEAELLDAKGLYAGPGLVDIHTHADGRQLFDKQPAQCCKTVLEHGVTSVLPALYFDHTKEEYLASIDLIKNAVAAGSCPNLLGVYMEGPYLNPKYGADKNNTPWGGEIKEEEYGEIIERVGDFAKVWALSPERDGIVEFAKNVKKNNPNAIFSVAHSEALPEQIEALIPYGLKLGTHHTNATGTIVNYSECRGVCVDETVNFHDDIYAELICDSMGIHVHPYMLRLVRKIKGRDKIILISDAFIGFGPPIPGCEEATDLCFDFDGEIAGSKMTLDVSCRNMMKHTGCSVCDAFHYASANPARMLGIPDIGRIGIGAAANIILVDEWFNVKKTILKGEIM